jgi:hypothetical protein
VTVTGEGVSHENRIVTGSVQCAKGLIRDSNIGDVFVVFGDNVTD